MRCNSLWQPSVNFRKPLFLFLILLLWGTLAAVHGYAQTPTYSISLGSGSFNPNPLIVDDTQPSPGTVTATANVTGTVTVNNANSEYQKNNDDQWSYQAQIVGYSATSNGQYGSMGSGTGDAPQLSGSTNGSITLTATQSTMAGYYEVQVTAYDQFTVTDSATSPATTTTENIASAPVNIFATIGDVSVTGPTSDVIVGEGVTYSAEVAPADLNPTYQWNVPGTVEDRVFDDFKTSIVYSPNGSEPEKGNAVDFPAGYLARQSISFYWTSSGGKTVSCAVLGKNPQVTTSVLAPTATITPVKTGGQIQIIPNGNSSSVEDGTLQAPGLKLSASFTVPSGFTTGAYQWVQIMTFNVTYNEQNGHVWTENLQGIDSEYPNASNADWSDDPDDTVNPADLYLGPGKGFTNPPLTDITTVTVADSFVDYLMWEPSGPTGEAIFVPVAFEKWNFPATVKGSNGSYTLTTSATPPTPTSTKPTSIWPSFTANVVDVIAVEK